MSVRLYGYKYNIQKSFWKDQQQNQKLIFGSITIGRVYRFSWKKYKNFVKKSFDRKNCMCLKRGFKGEDLYVFNFCVAFISSFKKEETSWNFFSVFQFYKNIINLC